jgi:hypothetical protein
MPFFIENLLADKTSETFIAEGIIILGTATIVGAKARDFFIGFIFVMTTIA